MHTKRQTLYNNCKRNVPAQPLLLFKVEVGLKTLRSLSPTILQGDKTRNIRDGCGNFLFFFLFPEDIVSLCRRHFVFFYTVGPIPLSSSSFWINHFHLAHSLNSTAISLSFVQTKKVFNFFSSLIPVSILHVSSHFILPRVFPEIGRPRHIIFVEHSKIENFVNAFLFYIYLSIPIIT